MKTAFHFQFNNRFFNNKYFVQYVCAIVTFVFFIIITQSTYAQQGIRAQNYDPFALTPEKMGIFTGLPDKFKGFFSSDNQVLNGFFKFVQGNFGGASGIQGTVPAQTYPPGITPIPVTGDFIKITSRWEAACIKDVPPDELYPARFDAPNEVCPWSPTTVASVCPLPMGICAQHPCFTMCISALSANSVTVTFTWSNSASCMCNDLSDNEITINGASMGRPRCINVVSQTVSTRSCDFPYSGPSVTVCRRKGNYNCSGSKCDACRTQNDISICVSQAAPLAGP